MSGESGHVVDAESGGGGATVSGYDPWGATRQPDDDGSSTAPAALPVGHRQFTGHETIPGLGLINMNGRIYDPKLARFLSADPNVQAVSDLQSYNHYSYVKNNPLRYTDPTGYFCDDFNWGGAVSALPVQGAIVACGASENAAVCGSAFAAAAWVNTAVMGMEGASFGRIIVVNVITIAASFAGGAAAAGIEEA